MDVDMLVVTVWFLRYTACSVMDVAVWQSGSCVYTACSVMDVDMWQSGCFVYIVILWT